MIKVNDTWYIDVDADNYSVGQMKNIRKYVDKNGEEKEVRKYDGFFTSLESALKFIRDKMVCESYSQDDLTMAEAIAVFREINKQFTEAFRRAVGE